MRTAKNTVFFDHLSLMTAYADPRLIRLQAEEEEENGKEVHQFSNMTGLMQQSSPSLSISSKSYAHAYCLMVTLNPTSRA